jgi:hypothetical protein
MTDLVYFTEDLVFDPQKKQFSTSDTVRINHRNWLRYFDNYGYSSLDDIWEPRLGKNFSKIGIMECGSEGDCLFYAIAEALNFENMKSMSNSDIYTVDSLREIAAEQITSDNFPLIIESYRLEADSFDFNGDWDPNDIQTPEELRTELIIPGNNYWGDIIVLQLLQQALGINFIILRSDDALLYPTATENSNYDKSIILYYENNIHFKLLGVFQSNNLFTVQKTRKLPKFIRDIIDIDTKRY